MVRRSDRRGDAYCVVTPAVCSASASASAGVSAAAAVAAATAVGVGVGALDMYLWCQHADVCRYAKRNVSFLALVELQGSCLVQYEKVVWRRHILLYHRQPLLAR